MKNAKGSSDDLPFDAQWLESKGWRQCSCLPSGLVGQLQGEFILPEMSENGHWVVLTQACDLVQKEIEQEPRVEVIFAQLRSKKLNKQKKHGNDPRELHHQDGTSDQKLGFHTKDRHCFDRARLMGHEPQPMIGDEETCGEITRWIARKYQRAAFAHSFNLRWYAIRKPWQTAVNQSEGDIYAIYIDVSGEEYEDPTPYRVDVVCVASAEAMQDEKIYRETESLVETFRELLKSCPGIEVNDCELRSMAEMSLDDIFQLQRFDFDAITIHGEGIGEAPVDP